MTLDYGAAQCTVSLDPVSDSEMKLVYGCTSNSGMPVEAHLTLIPHLGEEIEFASGEAAVLGEEPIDRSGEAWMAHAGWRLALSDGARVVWPALPHNPYKKGGEAAAGEARLVVVLPLSADVPEHVLTLEIP